MPKKNTSKLEASYNATCSKTPPKMAPETDQQSMNKNVSGYPMPPLGLTMASLGRLWGYPSLENVPKSTENVFQDTQNL